MTHYWESHDPCPRTARVLCAPRIMRSCYRILIYLKFFSPTLKLLFGMWALYDTSHPRIWTNCKCKKRFPNELKADNLVELLSYYFQLSAVTRKNLKESGEAALMVKNDFEPQDSTLKHQEWLRLSVERTIYEYVWAVEIGMAEITPVSNYRCQVRGSVTDASSHSLRKKYISFLFSSCEIKKFSVVSRRSACIVLKSQYICTRYVTNTLSDIHDIHQLRMNDWGYGTFITPATD